MTAGTVRPGIDMRCMSKTPDRQVCLSFALDYL